MCLTAGRDSTRHSEPLISVFHSCLYMAFTKLWYGIHRQVHAIHLSVQSGILVKQSHTDSWMKETCSLSVELFTAQFMFRCKRVLK